MEEKIPAYKLRRKQILSEEVNEYIDTVKHAIIWIKDRIPVVEKDIDYQKKRVSMLQNLVLNAAPGEDVSEYQDAIEEATRNYRSEEIYLETLNEYIDNL